MAEQLWHGALAARQFATDYPMPAAYVYAGIVGLVTVPHYFPNITTIRTPIDPNPLNDFDIQKVLDEITREEIGITEGHEVINIIWERFESSTNKKLPANVDDCERFNKQISRYLLARGFTRDFLNHTSCTTRYEGYIPPEPWTVPDIPTLILAWLQGLKIPGVHPDGSSHPVSLVTTTKTITATELHEYRGTAVTPVTIHPVRTKRATPACRLPKCLISTVEKWVMTTKVTRVPVSTYIRAEKTSNAAVIPCPGNEAGTEPLDHKNQPEDKGESVTFVTQTANWSKGKLLFLLEQSSRLPNLVAYFYDILSFIWPPIFPVISYEWQTSSCAQIMSLVFGSDLFSEACMHTDPPLRRAAFRQAVGAIVRPMRYSLQSWINDRVVAPFMYLLTVLRIADTQSLSRNWSDFVGIVRRVLADPGFADGRARFALIVAATVIVHGFPAAHARYRPHRTYAWTAFLAFTTWACRILSANLGGFSLFDVWPSSIGYVASTYIYHFTLRRYGFYTTKRLRQLVARAVMDTPRKPELGLVLASWQFLYGPADQCSHSSFRVPLFFIISAANGYHLTRYYLTNRKSASEETRPLKLWMSILIIVAGSWLSIYQCLEWRIITFAMILGGVLDRFGFGHDVEEVQVHIYKRMRTHPAELIKQLYHRLAEFQRRSVALPWGVRNALFMCSILGFLFNAIGSSSEGDQCTAINTDRWSAVFVLETGPAIFVVLTIYVYNDRSKHALQNLMRKCFGYSFLLSCIVYYIWTTGWGACDNDIPVALTTYFLWSFLSEKFCAIVLFEEETPEIRPVSPSLSQHEHEKTADDQPVVVSHGWISLLNRSGHLYSVQLAPDRVQQIMVTDNKASTLHEAQSPNGQISQDVRSAFEAQRVLTINVNPGEPVTIPGHPEITFTHFCACGGHDDEWGTDDDSDGDEGSDGNDQLEKYRQPEASPSGSTGPPNPSSSVPPSGPLRSSGRQPSSQVPNSEPSNDEEQPSGPEQPPTTTNPVSAEETSQNRTPPLHSPPRIPWKDKGKGQAPKPPSENASLPAFEDDNDGWEEVPHGLGLHDHLPNLPERDENMPGPSRNVITHRDWQTPPGTDTADDEFHLTGYTEDTTVEHGKPSSTSAEKERDQITSSSAPTVRMAGLNNCKSVRAIGESGTGSIHLGNRKETEEAESKRVVGSQVEGSDIPTQGIVQSDAAPRGHGEETGDLNFRSHDGSTPNADYRGTSQKTAGSKKTDKRTRDLEKGIRACEHKKGIEASPSLKKEYYEHQGADTGPNALIDEAPILGTGGDRVKPKQHRGGKKAKRNQDAWREETGREPFVEDKEASSAKGQNTMGSKKDEESPGDGLDEEGDANSNSHNALINSGDDSMQDPDRGKKVRGIRRSRKDSGSTKQYDQFRTESAARHEQHIANRQTKLAQQQQTDEDRPSASSFKPMTNRQLGGAAAATSLQQVETENQSGMDGRVLEGYGLQQGGQPLHDEAKKRRKRRQKRKRG